MHFTKVSLSSPNKWKYQNIMIIMRTSCINAMQHFYCCAALLKGTSTGASILWLHSTSQLQFTILIYSITPFHKVAT